MADKDDTVQVELNSDNSQKDTDVKNESTENEKVTPPAQSPPAVCEYIS